MVSLRVAAYREFLSSRIIESLPLGDDDSDRDDDSDDTDDYADDVDAADDVDGVDDVVEGTPTVNNERPMKGVGTVANKIETSADIDIHEQTSTPIHKQTQIHQQASTDINRHRQSL